MLSFLFRFKPRDFYLEHKAVIRTGKTCKEVPCYMRNSTCRWHLVKYIKTFRNYVKHS